MLYRRSNPLAGGPVHLIIAAWAYRHNQDLDNLGMNAVDYTDITGADAAASGQFSGKRLAGFVRFAVSDAGLNRFECRARLKPAQIFQISHYLMVIDYPPGHD
jgi:hypothetical protein